MLAIRLPEALEEGLKALAREIGIGARFIDSWRAVGEMGRRIGTAPRRGTGIVLKGYNCYNHINYMN